MVPMKTARRKLDMAKMGHSVFDTITGEGNESTSTWKGPDGMGRNSN